MKFVVRDEEVLLRGPIELSRGTVHEENAIGGWEVNQAFLLKLHAGMEPAKLTKAEARALAAVLLEFAR